MTPHPLPPATPYGPGTASGDGRAGALPPWAYLPAYAGDGHGGEAPVPPPAHPAGDGLAGRFSGDGQTGHLPALDVRPALRPPPPSDTWKLVCFVVAFFLWLAAGSTLLFLYMDHYYFG